jgi:hypothetical protein
MNAGRFHELVDAYGAELRRWPAEVRPGRPGFREHA